MNRIKQEAVSSVFDWTSNQLPIHQLKRKMLYDEDITYKIQERPLMQSIKGRRLIVYACVICWTTRNNQGQSPLSL